MDTEEIAELTGSRHPAAQREAFHCPHPSCGVFARQYWGDLYASVPNRSGLRDGWTLAICEACSEMSIWLYGELMYPSLLTGPAPSPDMPGDVAGIYNEARAVSSVSKKSAAGLLRLALQLLVDELEPGSANINTKIGRLVQRGLDPQVQQAMDVLRVVGNEAVHPGTIDLDADDALLPALFGLVNLIVDQVITRPRHIGSLFGMLPAEKLEAITRRDGGN